ncbi:hypothetical protein [Helicobacter marmotae]|uniref:Uncharacterized protein n=1 Tax=Helicobacter marmotae TaxID=152490 RepID=A0A3D8I2A6_9HELI|nr:hypothetical protein [Helicobacter marmotae]RDU59262.1 hypothetical protein CQA63_07395 [Helicobacter marmotae]
MLDSAQNAILNKTNTSPSLKRPHSPSNEVNTLEEKFSDLFAKAAQNNKSLKDEKALQIQGASKAPKALKDDKITKEELKLKATPDTPHPQDSKMAKTPSKAPASQLAGFDFKDSKGEDSKIGLQEKIAKTSKEPKAEEANPLIEALSSPLHTKATKTEPENKPESKSHLSNAPKTQLHQASQQSQHIEAKPSPITAPKSASSARSDDSQTPKTLADVQAIASAKGLNPSNITLTQEEAQAPAAPKVKSIPLSAKETISYEYENNVDRIAIVKRGVKKPSNITSKISNEYPSKKPDGSPTSPLKDTP